VSAKVDEIAPDLFKITTYVREIDLQFSQFLLRDDEPLLFETGMRSLFPNVVDAVARLIPPSSIRWIGFSHYEPDECGSLDEWMELAPASIPVCSFVGAFVNVNMTGPARPARPLQHGETIRTGKHSVRFLSTPHVPHAWDAGLLFEETDRTLLCSDLFHQNGDVEAKTAGDVVGRARAALEAGQKTPFANYFPAPPWLEKTMDELAKLAPKRLATMHGSTYEGDGARALSDMAKVYREVMGRA
jgi:flavorubredoxin